MENIDTLKNIDTLQTANVNQIVEQTTKESNPWMWIAIIGMFIIVILLFVLLKKPKNKNRQIKEGILSEGDIDFGNIMNSAFHAEALYKNLIKVCHPDRFAPDKAKMEIATDISLQIGKNKYDVKALKELAEEAKCKLNIEIK